MNGEEARTIGRRVRQIRYARRKSLRVIAGLAGMSTNMLYRIEKGQRALDSRSETAALANALQVAPSELVMAPELLPGNGEHEAVKAVRRALVAVGRDDPGGTICPADVLQARIEALVNAQRQCDHEQVGHDLPTLIRDLHTSMAAGRDLGELLSAAVLLHVQGSHAFLADIGAPADLCWQAATLGLQAARQHEDANSLGLASFGAANGLLAAGEFDEAQTTLDAVTVPTTSSEAEQLDAMLALSRSLIAAADQRPGDVDAPLEYAEDLAQRTGQGNAYWLGFGPTNVGVWRMSVALEARDYVQAAAVGETLRPELLPTATRRATYWANYGRTLARIRGREEDAVRALRKAELISPARVQRNPFVRDVLAEPLVHARRDAVGRELRGMAYRAGLPV